MTATDPGQGYRESVGSKNPFNSGPHSRSVVFGEPASGFDTVLMVAAPLLVRVPVALGAAYPGPLRWLLLLPFAVSIAINLVRVNRNPTPRVDGLLAMLWAGSALLTSAAFLRAVFDARAPTVPSLDGWIVFLALATFGILAYLASPSQEGQSRLRRALLAGLTIYLLVNLGLYVAGVRNPETLYYKLLPAHMLAFLGVDTPAALFPMATDISAFGSVGGAVAAMSAAILSSRARSPSLAGLAIVGALLGWATVVWTDARAALVWSLATGGLIAWARGRRGRELRWLVILPCVVPPLYLMSLALVPEAWWAAGGESLRQVASLSNRESIWRAVWSALLKFEPLHLVGYGMFGQQVSGIAEGYRGFFSAYVYGALTTAHNAFLQTVIETGWIGACVISAGVAASIHRLVAPGTTYDVDGERRILLGLLVYLCLAGTLESTWSPQNQELHTALQLALAGALVLPRPAPESET